jgi:zinc protease
MTIPRIRILAGKYLNSSRMFYLVVGDAATQLARLEELGLGKPVLLNAK